MTASGAAAAGEPVPLTAELARVTGLVLVVLLPVHLVTVLLAEPADGVALAARWEQRGWLFADWGLLAVGTAHALLHLAPRLAALPGRAGRLIPAALVGGTVALFLAASWAMLRLV